MGGLADIGKYFTDDEINEYVEDYIDEGLFSGNGSLKIFPTAKSTEIMVLNYTDWQNFSNAEGVTVDDLKTWESIAEIAEKYYKYTDDLTPDIENDGKAFFGRDSVANYMIVGARQLGEEFISFDESGKPVLNVDSFELITDIPAPCCTAYGSVPSKFGTGRTIFSIGYV